MIRWVLASSPLIVLLVTMLGLKWKAKRAGTLAWIVALAVAWIFFGGHPQLLAMASAKGVSLTLFVVLIIWTSAFMFQIINETGTVPVISRWMGTLSSDSLMLGLLMGWALSGVIQAVAGYGVPVAVCAPLMIAAGFDPLVAASATLVGHAWSITFGSMGSSYYTLNLSTKLPGDVLSHWVGLTFIVPTVLTGLAVAHITHGFAGVRRGFAKILAAGLAMGTVQWVIARMGSAQIAALLGSLAGVVVIVLTSSGRRTQSMASQGSQREVSLALTPYYALLALTMISQIGPVKAFFKPFKFGVDYPAMVTRLGYQVVAEKAYAAIGLFSHPAPIIALASMVGIAVYRWKGLLQPGALGRAWQNTVKQCWPTTLGVLTMVMMALVMTDTGMTREMALGVASFAGPLFPLVSPFVGVLGCFMTGSNTNANILFGSFQVETARTLGLSSTLVAASQTCGASLGSSIAPSKVLLGSSTSGLTGREHEVLRKCLPYCLLIVLLLGAQTLVVTRLLPPTLVP
ncbi:MAG: L-lactate permease [Bacillota bacterium]|jgi:lactate permease